MANITKEFSHKLIDYPLTPKGSLQARQTADYFKNKNIHGIFASPLKRAIETAEIIAHVLDLGITVVENFREINVGTLEGQAVSEENWETYLSIIYGWYDGNHGARFPGGEDYSELLDRMKKGFKQVIKNNTGKNIIIVGHGGIFVATIKDICQNADINELRQLENHNCSISTMNIGLDNGQVTGELLTWASASHLHGKAAELVSGLPSWKLNS